MKIETKEEKKEKEMSNYYNNVEITRTKISDKFDSTDGSVVCVWQATIMKDDDIPDFEKWFTEEFDVEECTFLESIKTLPTIENNKPVKGTGGRQDVIFSVKLGPSSAFPMQRLNTLDIKWLEDMVSAVNNPKGIIYPSYIMKYVE